MRKFCNTQARRTGRLRKAAHEQYSTLSFKFQINCAIFLREIPHSRHIRKIEYPDFKKRWTIPSANAGQCPPLHAGAGLALHKKAGTIFAVYYPGMVHLAIEFPPKADFRVCFRGDHIMSLRVYDSTGAL